MQWIFPAFMILVPIMAFIKNELQIGSILFLETLFGIIAFSLFRDINKYKKRFDWVYDVLGIKNKVKATLFTEISFAIDELKKEFPNKYEYMVFLLLELMEFLELMEKENKGGNHARGVSN